MRKANKKLAKIAVIIVCLGLAGGIILKSRSGRSGLDTVQRGQMIWVKCGNPDCGAEYEIDNKDYWQYIEQHRNPMAMSAPALTCKECQKKSIYKAVKCEKCDLIFFHGTNQTSYADACPKCGFSKIKEQRNSGQR